MIIITSWLPYLISLLVTLWIRSNKGISWQGSSNCKIKYPLLERPFPILYHPLSGEQIFSEYPTSHRVPLLRVFKAASHNSLSVALNIPTSQPQNIFRKMWCNSSKLMDINNLQLTPSIKLLHIPCRFCRRVSPSCRVEVQAHHYPCWFVPPSVVVAVGRGISG